MTSLVPASAPCSNTSLPRRLVTLPAIREIFENVAKRASALETQLIDVLDRILDKGTVIDAWLAFP